MLKSLFTYCFAPHAGNFAEASRSDCARALDELSSTNGDLPNRNLNSNDVKEMCDKGSHRACFAYALMALEGKGGLNQNVQLAADILRSSCEHGNEKACFYLARVTTVEAFRGTHIRLMAGEYYRKACTMGNGEACYNYGQLLDQGKGDLVSSKPASTRDRSEARKQKRVAKFFGLACEKGVSKGCVNLGVMEWEGKGITKNEKHALHLFQAACRMGEGAGCGFAGDMLRERAVETQNNNAEAAEMYYAGCQQGNARCCLIQAKMLEDAAIEAVKAGTSTGEHALQARARAVMFFRRACELGNALGCKRFLGSNDAFKVIDTRNESEKAWLNVTPQTEESIRTPSK
ncbi:hypothetical protein GUITHDRAFT_135643 [Guillardia theta CCMP2712]|uniref:Beta-lactamase n=1 Tax=Guillardia theta (strain CCMP2712) TaxID=905079 RepID=L1JNV1_GUITC|nr:hypothetical protein GUITHDRAFT_135643 [Guillardia theta CCMP2712]EKX49959.1 hypothetical protein GUITHDRAFT_135643 [Guillardia theta CCMP2712]|eukprot:XP_005836939.1 hypothetical protein GUITHDRAFT_135643 [Guillardia theta CCMP2712]